MSEVQWTRVSPGRSSPEFTRALMDPRRDPGGSFPTAEQELLLQAILTEGEEGIDAYRQWKSQIHIDFLDSGSYRLLPQLYARLSREKIEDELLPKLKGLYRYHWAKNQMLFDRAAALVNELRKQSVEVMVLKGVSMTASYYGDLGLRPMEDFDFLVPRQAVSRVVGWMKKNGFSPADPSYVEPNFNRHGINFINRESLGFDVHWFVIHHRCWEEVTEVFWERKVPLAFRGIEAFSLCPTHLFFHVCVHGLRWSGSAHLRWVTDAVRLLRKDEIDWSHFLELGEKLRLQVPLRECLGYLNSRWGLAFPKEVLDSLRRASTHPLEEKEFRVLNGRPTFWGELPSLWCRHRMRGRILSEKTGGRTFLRFLVEWYGKKNFLGLTRELALRSVRKLRKAFSLA
ncbi:MAG: nucleotidyltransferase family protein [bacterium]